MGRTGIFRLRRLLCTALVSSHPQPVVTRRYARKNSFSIPHSVSRGPIAWPISPPRLERLSLVERVPTPTPTPNPLRALARDLVVSVFSFQGAWRALHTREEGRKRATGGGESGAHGSGVTTARERVGGRVDRGEQRDPPVRSRNAAARGLDAPVYISII